MPSFTVKIASVFSFVALVASCGPSPETVARFKNYEANIWQCSATNGGRTRLALAEKYRSDQGKKAHILVVVPSETTTSADAGRINSCLFGTVGAPERTSEQARYFINLVYPSATPASRGEALGPSESADYLRKYEGAAGVYGPIIANPRSQIVDQQTYNPAAATAPSSSPISASANRGLVNSTASGRVSTTSFGCPKHADVLHGGAQYCLQ